MSFIIGVILGGATLVFILQNMIPITVNFLSWEMEGSLALLILFSVLVGMAIASLFSIPTLFENSGLRRYSRKLEKDLDTHKLKLSETEGKLSQAEAPVVLVEENTLEREV